MNIIFNIEGGLGKSIMATAVCEAIKKKYPKDNLIVLTSYPEVFICNNNVDKCFNHNNLNYLYKDYIDNKEVKMMLHNPYNETGYIKQSEHLIETWCNMFEIPYNNEQPKIHLTDREVKFYSNLFISEKPIFVLQTNGGAVNQEIKYSWARDLPFEVAQKIADEFSGEYNILHIRRENQFQLNNTTPVTADFRKLAVLIQLSSKRLLIDSFAQHTAKALGLNSVVTWVANNPKQLGYENNINILANPETVVPELKGSVFSKYQIDGNLIEFPYNSESEIFNVEEIINAIREVE
jgi:hypothetical protein